MENWNVRNLRARDSGGKPAGRHKRGISSRGNDPLLPAKRGRVPPCRFKPDTGTMTARRSSPSPGTSRRTVTGSRDWRRRSRRAIPSSDRGAIRGEATSESEGAEQERERAGYKTGGAARAGHGDRAAVPAPSFRDAPAPGTAARGACSSGRCALQAVHGLMGAAGPSSPDRRFCSRTAPAFSGTMPPA